MSLSVCVRVWIVSVTAPLCLLCLSVQSSGDSGSLSDFASLAHPNAAAQLKALLKRTWLSYWRDTNYNTTRIISTAFFYTFLGAVFRDISRTDYASVQVQHARVVVVLSDRCVHSSALCE
jgi:hypothetical protein